MVLCMLGIVLIEPAVLASYATVAGGIMGASVLVGVLARRLGRPLEPGESTWSRDLVSVPEPEGVKR